MKTKTKKKKKTKASSSSPHTGAPESSDLNTAVARISVAQICKSAGYGGAQTSALETLTDVAVRYLRSLATSAATSAGSTGRTQCNLLDIVSALEHLHSDIGFRGNSDPKRRLNSLSDSSILRDLMMFVHRTREIPFAQSFPRRSDPPPSHPPWFSGEIPKLNHIPRWLPCFPQITDKSVVIAASSEDLGLDLDLGLGEGEGEFAWKKKMRWIESNREISKLPAKRKPVSFKISGGGGGCRNAIEVEFGVCKGGKRISLQNYDENHESKQCMKMKLEEECSRAKMMII